MQSTEAGQRRPTDQGGGVFATLPAEHDYVVDEVEGTLPDGLRGTYYRMGCGTFDAGGEPVNQVFDGDGLVSMFVLDGVVSALTRAHAVAKVDGHDGTVRIHELAAGHVVSEAVFVPRSATAPEDDGWLLAVAYDPSEHRSRLLVLDARAPERAPLFSASLRHHIPFGFHNHFTGRVAS